MKKLFRKLLGIGLAVALAFGIMAAPVVKSGYKLYKQAVTAVPLSQKVDEIRMSDGYTPLKEISPVFIEQLLESEDRRFYSHFAIDPISLFRAVVTNITRGGYVQGGSTITQQLAKNMYFSFEKQMSRKIAELFVAWDLEKNYSKDEILAMYCALAYFGQNCYGVKRACGYYYGIEPIDIDDHKAQQLVRTLKAPSVYNPSTM